VVLSIDSSVDLSRSLSALKVSLEPIQAFVYSSNSLEETGAVLVVNISKEVPCSAECLGVVRKRFIAIFEDDEVNICNLSEYFNVKLRVLLLYLDMAVFLVQMKLFVQFITQHSHHTEIGKTGL
jgi:hypothetical protein